MDYSAPQQLHADYATKECDASALHVPITGDALCLSLMSVGVQLHGRPNLIRSPGPYFHVASASEEEDSSSGIFGLLQQALLPLARTRTFFLGEGSICWRQDRTFAKDFLMQKHLRSVRILRPNRHRIKHRVFAYCIRSTSSYLVVRLIIS